MTQLKKLSSEREFDNFQDSVIKNMIACGTRDNPLRERLFWGCDLTLFKAISAGHDAGKTVEHALKIPRSQDTANIDKIFKKKLNKSYHSQIEHNTLYKKV